MGILKYKESAPDVYYHLYNRGNQKRIIFNNSSDYSFYLSRLRKALNKYDFSLIGYCLMPNHIHLIAKQNGQFSPSNLLSSVHTSYVMVYNMRHNTVGHLFQDRFKQKIIYDDEYMKCLIAYIHLNPVKEKICESPEQYKWSSYREYRGTTHHRICNHDLIEEYGLKGQPFEKFIKLAHQVNPEDAFDN